MGLKVEASKLSGPCLWRIRPLWPMTHHFLQVSELRNASVSWLGHACGIFFLCGRWHHFCRVLSLEMRQSAEGALLVTYTSIHNFCRFLSSEMRQSAEWDVLVTHFLGVDHAGHKYGPNHAEMGRKLTEMNAVIEATIKILPRDAVLFGKYRRPLRLVPPSSSVSTAVLFG
jgi:predicted AlkP superfamily pyrophosphatase or phosphodiesterase